MILYNRRSSLDVTLWQRLRERPPARQPASEVAEEAEAIEPVLGPESYPHLTPAGVEPAHPVQPWIDRRSSPVELCGCSESRPRPVRRSTVAVERVRYQ